MTPEESYEVVREYLEGTNVLVTTYTTPSGRVTVTQA